MSICQVTFLASFVAIMVIGLSGCGYSQANAANAASTVSKNNSTTKQTMKQSEFHTVVPVSAVSITERSIKAGVMSNGCTTDADFTVTEEIVDGVCHVTINRIKPDLCRRVPFVLDIEINWSVPQACSDMDIVLANPLLVTTDGEHLFKRTK